MAEEARARATEAGDKRTHALTVSRTPIIQDRMPVAHSSGERR